MDIGYRAACVDPFVHSDCFELLLNTSINSIFVFTVFICFGSLLKLYVNLFQFRKGISKFYNGKSKSFTSLADVSGCSSVKDLAKPENAYARKRRNLLAYSNYYDKSRNCPLRSNGGGISKRPFNTSRSTLALAVTMSSSESGNSCEDSNPSANLSSSHSPFLPPLHPQAKKSSNNVPSSSSSPPSQQKFPPWRSFSLSDLQSMDAATPSITGLAGSNNREGKNEPPH